MNTTETTAGASLWAVAVLREEKKATKGLLLRYRFCGCCFAKKQYYVEICLGNERAAAYLGTDKEAACEVFKALVDGTVTPCTLADIMEDIKNSAASPLQI